MKKLLDKIDNQKAEIKRLNWIIRGQENLKQLLINALIARGCTPVLGCTCQKEDCGCLESSLAINPSNPTK